MKSGQARVLDAQTFTKVIDAVSSRRYPEKNRALLHVSFCLGLRAQEIALLQIKEVARLTGSGGFVLNQILALPASYTKGANALRDSVKARSERVISFKTKEFDKLVRAIEERAKNNLPIDPRDFYPEPRKPQGKSRDIPMVDKRLRESLTEYLEWRLAKAPNSKPTDPLFVTQKGGPYSPNTLQEHFGLMLKDWGGVERASSHSGRRTLLTNIIRKTNDLKAAQKLAGHRSPSTTLIYTEATEADIAEALTAVEGQHTVN